MSAGQRKLPTRMHHHAFVVADQERTRHFYEDIIGLPLRATWVESAQNSGQTLVFSHTFFGLADGSALAFFNFADKEVQKKFYAGPQPNLCYHIALNVDAETQDAIAERCKAAHLTATVMEHGYCKSLYITDPDGLMVEFTVDAPDVEEINAMQQRIARKALDAWQAGDTSPNNLIRPHE
jgi:catechol 2,3-dioxygenase-like lactoylglutathione lyase family enzyme